MFYSHHEAKDYDYDEVTTYTDEDDLILDDEEDEYDEDFSDDDEDLLEEDEEGEAQEFYANGTVIKFKCSQTNPTQFASWQIRFSALCICSDYFRLRFSGVSQVCGSGVTLHVLLVATV